MLKRLVPLEFNWDDVVFYIDNTCFFGPNITYIHSSVKYQGFYCVHGVSRQNKHKGEQFCEEVVIDNKVEQKVCGVIAGTEPVPGIPNTWKVVGGKEIGIRESSLVKWPTERLGRGWHTVEFRLLLPDGSIKVLAKGQFYVSDPQVITAYAEPNCVKLRYATGECAMPIHIVLDDVLPYGPVGFRVVAKERTLEGANKWSTHEYQAVYINHTLPQGRYECPANHAVHLHGIEFSLDKFIGKKHITIYFPCNYKHATHFNLPVTPPVEKNPYYQYQCQVAHYSRLELYLQKLDENNYGGCVTKSPRARAPCPRHDCKPKGELIPMNVMVPGNCMAAPATVYIDENLVLHHIAPWGWSDRIYINDKPVALIRPRDCSRYRTPKEIWFNCMAMTNINMQLPDEVKKALKPGDKLQAELVPEIVPEYAKEQCKEFFKPIA